MPPATPTPTPVVYKGALATVPPLSQEDTEKLYLHKGAKMLAETRKFVVPWIERVIRHLVWSPIRNSFSEDQIRKAFYEWNPPSHKDNAYFPPKIKDAKIYHDVHHKWFTMVSEMRANSEHMKSGGSVIKYWADENKGPCEMAKLFASSCAKIEEAQKVSSLDQLDPDAIFGIVVNCEKFKNVYPSCKLDDCIQKAKTAHLSRQKLKHDIDNKIKEEDYIFVKNGMKNIVEIINASLNWYTDGHINGLYDESYCIFDGLTCIDASYLDAIDKMASIAEEDKAFYEAFFKNQKMYDELCQESEMKQNSLLTASLKHLIPSEDSQCLVFESYKQVMKHQSDWIPNSRNSLVKAINETNLSPCPSVIWLHGQPGTGKSSIASYVLQEEEKRCIVLKHFFVYKGAFKNSFSASLEIAVIYSFILK